MRLVRRRAPRAQLLQREHQLDRIEQRDDPRQTRWGQAARKPNQLVARHADIDEPPRDLHVLELRSLAGNVQVEPVAGDEVIERIPVLLAPAVELDDPPIFDDERGRRIVRAVHRNEPELDQRLDRKLATQTARLPRDEARRALVRLQEALAPRRPAPPRARTPP